MNKNFSKSAMKKMLQALVALAVITAQNPMGFTYSLKAQSLQRSGYAVALAATQNSFDEEGLFKVVEYATAHDIDCIGFWLDQKTGLCYYDATVICETLEEAIELGKANDQIAIYDLNNNQEIRL